MLQDAPSMAKPMATTIPKITFMGCTNHPQMVRLWHWVYQVIPHTSAGKKYGSLTSLSIDAPLPTVSISWSPTKGVLGGVKFRLDISVYLSDITVFTLYPVSILTWFGFCSVSVAFLYLRPTQNQCIWTDLGSHELQPPVVKRRAQGHAWKHSKQSLQHFSQRHIGKHDAIWHIWCPNVSKSQLKWVCKITKKTV